MLLPEQKTNVVVEDILVSDGYPATHVSFGPIENYEANLSGFLVTVLADTLPIVTEDFLRKAQAPESSIWGNPRLVTIVARFPRCVLSEVNTHRVFSRNSASSRAKAVKVTIADVMNEPYIPIFTENRKGMTGQIVDLKSQKKAEVFWLAARDNAVASVLSMLLGREVLVEDARENWSSLAEEYYTEVYNAEEKPEDALNLHKQNVNRILEPYMWHEAVITSTEWENFIELRDEDEADPAIHALGLLTRVALENSEPAINAIHAPFARHLVPPLEVYDNEVETLGLLKASIEAMDYSSGASAQVSYRPVVGSEGVGANPANLAKRLLTMKHMSPFEHSAVSASWAEELGFKGETKSNLSNFWHQYRQLIPSFQDEEMASQLEETETFKF